MNASCSRSHVMQVTIENIEVSCEDSALYIYEGLPYFLSINASGDHQSLVGTFCTGHFAYPVTLETKTGVMTVFYEKSAAGHQGFNAFYRVLRCPDRPGNNRVCLLDRPVCNEGWRGPDCDVPVCRNKCSEGLGQGRCDPVYGRCICHRGFVGEDCAIARKDHLVRFRCHRTSSQRSGSPISLFRLLRRAIRSVALMRNERNLA